MASGFEIPDNDVAAFPIQSQLFFFDFEVIRRAHAGYRIISGCEVTAQGSPDLSVHVAAGVIRPGDSSRVAVVADDLVVDAADATDFRIDIISVSNTGVLTITTGSAQTLAACKPPTLPANHIALALVYVPPTATIVDSDQIKDRRLFFAKALEPSWGGQDDIEIVASSGAAYTADLANGNHHDITLTAATVTLSLDGFVDGVRCGGELLLRQDGTGGRLVDWPAAMDWDGFSAPTLKTGAGEFDVIEYFSTDGGVTIHGYHKGSALDGTNGTNGDDGADGLGVPAGGTTGQVLKKSSNADNDTEWADETGGTPAYVGAKAYNSTTEAKNSVTQSACSLDSEEFDSDAFHFTSAAALTGTVAKTATSANIVGTGTAFTTELAVNQIISIPGTAAEIGVVKTITDDTHLELWQVMANTASGQTATRVNNAMAIPASKAGKYGLQGGTFFSAQGSNVSFKRNGAIVRGACTLSGAGYGQANTELDMAEGDYVSICVTTNGTANVGHATLLDAQTWFALHLIGA